MLKVGNWYIPLTCLIVWALFFPNSSYADSYFCKAEHVSGYVFDLENNTWQSSALPIENRQYLVSEADIENVFIKALKYDYEITTVGSAKPIIHCKSVKLTDSNEETGLVVCRDSLGASFKIDKRSGRYIRSQPTGYVSHESVAEVASGPFLEIGNCFPK